MRGVRGPFVPVPALVQPFPDKFEGSTNTRISSHKERRGGRHQVHLDGGCDSPRSGVGHCRRNRVGARLLDLAFRCWRWWGWGSPCGVSNSGLWGGNLDVDPKGLSHLWHGEQARIAKHQLAHEPLGVLILAWLGNVRVVVAGYQH